MGTFTDHHLFPSGSIENVEGDHRRLDRSGKADQSAMVVTEGDVDHPRVCNDCGRRLDLWKSDKKIKR